MVKPFSFRHYLVSVRSNLILPSTSFSYSITRITFSRLADRFKSACKELSSSTSLPCPAHNVIYFYFLYNNKLKEKSYIEEQALDNYANTIEIAVVNELKQIFVDFKSDFTFIDNQKSCKSIKQQISVTYSSLQISYDQQCKLVDISKIRNLTKVPSAIS